MERLTHRLKTGETIMATEYEGKYTKDEWICVLQVCLAAYEDAGLTPEEVYKVRMDTEAGYMRSIARAYGIDVERLKELARADRDGRVVVLPCKVGETVCFAADFNLRDSDKTVFLTREEAEEVVRRID